MEDKTFQKAFNAGYMLEKYVPALSQLLAKSLKNSTTTFSEGFLAGSQQYTEEKNHKDELILTFFDNDQMGKEATENFRVHFSEKANPQNHRYEGFEDYNQKVKTIVFPELNEEV